MFFFMFVCVSAFHRAGYLCWNYRHSGACRSESDPCQSLYEVCRSGQGGRSYNTGPRILQHRICGSLMAEGRKLPITSLTFWFYTQHRLCNTWMAVYVKEPIHFLVCALAANADRTSLHEHSQHCVLLTSSLKECVPLWFKMSYFSLCVEQKYLTLCKGTVNKLTLAYHNLYNVKCI